MEEEVEIDELKIELDVDIEYFDEDDYKINFKGRNYELGLKANEFIVHISNMSLQGKKIRFKMGSKGIDEELIVEEIHFHFRRDSFDLSGVFATKFGL